MVVASHVIISAYGFWLPNDQRGSWSDFVRRWELLRFGRATKVDTRESVAHRPFDPALRAAAKRALTFPEVEFSGVQAREIARGFADRIARSGYVCYACAILPQHTHFVLGRHRFHVELMTNQLKGAATRALVAANLHPLQKYRTKDGNVPSPWGEGLWKVFIDDDVHLRRAVKYVYDNPLREGKKRQEWSFVRPIPI